MSISYKIHHISINVKNLKDTISFYNKLGFVHLYSNSIIIELFYYKKNKELPKCSKKIRNNQYGIGCEHFSFSVDNIYSAFEKFKNCAESKSPILGRTGITYFFIKDPNDVRIEIVEDKREINNEKQSKKQN